jgi:hypothetical protein
MCKAEIQVLIYGIPGPYNLGWNKNVCLLPLIDELNKLWPVRALTYDFYRNRIFQMKTTLMWTRNDFFFYTRWFWVGANMKN